MTRKAWIIPLFGILLFFLTALAVIPYPGLQNDEVLFATTTYDPAAAWYRIELGHFSLPLMLTSYSGSLKTWLYEFLLLIFIPSKWLVRIPMVAAGCGTIWLTWWWTRRIAGTRAATFTVALLATDTLFLLTNTFDWGPVALQHLLLLAGIAALHLWLTKQSTRLLATAFFLWGLGTWDKALMVWPLAGLALAALLLYAKEVRRHTTRPNLGIAAAAFLIGALPLVWFNIARPGATVSENAAISRNDRPAKIFALTHTFNGSMLFDYIASRTPGHYLRRPSGLLEEISVEIADRIGTQETNWMTPASILAVACLVLLWRSPRLRTLLFLLIAMVVLWMQMFLNAGTGVGAHHIILLWPLPCMFIGIAFAEIAAQWKRLALPAALLIACVAGKSLLVTNQYLADMIVNGTVGGWTDAFYRLSDVAELYRKHPIGAVDWGYLNGIRLLHDGDLDMFTAGDQIMNETMSEQERKDFANMLQKPNAVYIQHTEDQQIFTGINAKLRDAALKFGYTEQVERTVRDRNARPIFEIFHFVPNSNPTL